MRKRKNITNKLYPAALLLVLVIVWEVVSDTGIIPKFMLPAPSEVFRAFISEFPRLMHNSRVSLTEAFIGLFTGLFLSVVLAVLMDRFAFMDKAVYPILVITQTVPVIAIAPLLVLWMGYGMAPKITLVILVCFFPITIGLLNGFRTADEDAIRLLKSMGASKLQIMRHCKLPAAMPSFFAGLKISVSYSVVGAVIAEWLGGTEGLGVYMTRAKKTFAFDKMFAVIFLVIIISLILMFIVGRLERLTRPWERKKIERIQK